MRTSLQLHRRIGLTAGALLVMAGLGSGSGVQADIYKYIDPQGVVHLADRRLGPGYKLIMRTAKGSSAKGGGALLAQRRKFTPLIEALAHKYRLDSALVHAVVRMESAYDPEAVSKKGAVGLMQLMPATAKRYGVSDRRNPAQNVAGGVRYLRDLLVQFRSVALAVAAYNAGENAVIRHGNKIPPYPETQRYVHKVLSHYQELKRST